AWDYKASLLIEASKLAEMENNPARKAWYRKQSEEIQRRAGEINVRMEKERQEKWEEERKNEEASRKQWAVKRPDGPAQLTKELTEYKVEHSPDEAVEEFSYAAELTPLVAPVPIDPHATAPEPGDTTENREPAPQRTQQGCLTGGLAQTLEKREWKVFSPADEDITAELPDNVCYRGGNYVAASEGVIYSINPIPRQPPTPLDPTAIDGDLNALARYMIGFLSRSFLTGGSSFELKLLRKEVANDQASQVYAYAVISCSHRREGVFIVYASKTHYYSIEISGADESDQRVQRFIKSVRFR
ncbi:MAG: hypothetical protein ACRD68_11330, partial [Pyrinomonadaceae bacterium]